MVDRTCAPSVERYERGVDPSYQRQVFLRIPPSFRAGTMGCILVIGCSGARRMHVNPASAGPGGASGYTLDPCGADAGRERIAVGEAIIGWRAAISRDTTKDGEMVVVVAGGGDLSPQRIVAYQQCTRGLVCTGKPERFKGVFGARPRWSSLDFLYASQVQFARLAPGGEPLVFVSTYYGTARYPRSGPCGAGVQYYAPTASNYSCRDAGGERLAPTPLLSDISVFDFVAEDLNGDGKVDLVVAAKGVAGPGECRGEDDPPPGHWGLVFDPEETPPFEFETIPDAAGASLQRPFVGIYFNRGDATKPPFGSEPDAWFQVRPAPSKISEPTRVITVDLNRDGWQDIAVSFNGQFTAGWLSQRGQFTPPEQRLLSEGACTGQFWCVGSGGKMTADMAGVVLEDRTLLLETRGCYPGHSAKECTKGGGVYASRHDERRSWPLFEDGVGLPTFVTTARRGGVREISFGWTRGVAERLEPEVRVMPLSLDGRRVIPVVAATDVLALRSSGFAVAKARPVSWRSPPAPSAKGPYVAVPAAAWHAVESVSYCGVSVERCRPGVRECWDYPGGAWSPTPAILAYGHGGRVVEVTYTPVDSHNQLLPSALPLLNAFSLGGATVLWRDRPAAASPATTATGAAE